MLLKNITLILMSFILQTFKGSPVDEFFLNQNIIYQMVRPLKLLPVYFIFLGRFMKNIQLFYSSESNDIYVPSYNGFARHDSSEMKFFYLPEMESTKELLME